MSIKKDIIPVRKMCVLKKIVECLLLLLALTLPYSRQFFLFENLGINVPSEVLLLLIAVLGGIYLLVDFWGNPLAFYWKCREDFRWRSLSYWLFAYIIWMGITASVAIFPVRAVKSYLVTIGMIFPCYYVALQMMRLSPRFMDYLLSAICIGMGLSVVYVGYQRFCQPDLEVDKLFRVVQPFYADHTHFSAIVALVLPVSVYLSFRHPKVGMRYVLAVSTLMMLGGLALCSSRAALLSLFVAGFVGILSLIRMKKIYWGIFTVGLALGVWGGVVWGIPKLQQMSEGKSLNPIVNLISLSNLKEDVSSMERVNRWKCSLRIFQDYPWTGCGDCCFSPLYGKYQKFDDLTAISTFQGDLGDQDNEYLRHLNSFGLPGLLIFLGWLVLAFYLGIQVYFKSKERYDRYLVGSLVLGLTTYFFHSFFNNFMYTDKAGVILYFFLAVIYAEYRKMETAEAKEENGLQS